MKKKICILTSGHPPLDDRIFWRFGLSFVSHNFDVTILCSTQIIDAAINDVRIKGFDGNNLSKKVKIDNFLTHLIKAEPDLIICCEPLTILPAHRFKKRYNKKVKIILDVTEYYPHQNFLNKFNTLVRVFPFLTLSAFNIFVSSFTDYIIVGEKWKARQYKFFVPFVKKKIIGYYTSKRFFKSVINKPSSGKIIIGFAGSGSNDKGFNRFTVLIASLLKELPDTIFNIKLFGDIIQINRAKLKEELSSSTNLEIEMMGNLDYPVYCKSLEMTDILIDLRDKNKIFNKSLPITFFDFIAACKPFIFSDLNSFNQLDDIHSQIKLFDPDDIDKIKNHLKSLILDSDFYLKNASISKILFEEKYNWEILEKELIEIVNNQIS